VASDPRISAPIALEEERNHIRRTLSAGQKFNSLLDRFQTIAMARLMRKVGPLGDIGNHSAKSATG